MTPARHRLPEGPKTNRSSARAVYLEAAYDLMREQLLVELPPRDKVALCYSFPSAGGRGARRKTTGECHYGGLSGSDETHLVAIHPCEWTDDVRMLATLAHELAHIVAGPEAGHRGKFVRLAREIGLVGKPTATTAGPAFELWVEETARRALPTFPAGALDLGGRHRVQGTRQRLYHCGCEPPVKVRTARDDLDATCNACGCVFELQAAKTDSHGSSARGARAMPEHGSPVDGSTLRDVALSEVTGHFSPYYSDGQPVLLTPRGSTELFLLLFSTEEKLRAEMARLGIAFDEVLRVDDGAEFLSSLPATFRIAVDHRAHPDGGENRHRWSELFRPAQPAPPSTYAAAVGANAPGRTPTTLLPAAAAPPRAHPDGGENRHRWSAREGLDP